MKKETLDPYSRLADAQATFLDCLNDLHIGVSEIASLTEAFAGIGLGRSFQVTIQASDEPAYRKVVRILCE